MMGEIQVVSQAREIEEDNNLLKIVLLGVLGVLASISSIYFFEQFFSSGTLWYLVLGILVSVLFLVFSLLHVCFIKGNMKIRLLACIEGCAPLVLFIDRVSAPFGYILFGGAILASLFFMGGLRKGVRALSNGMHVRFFEMARSVLPRIATGFLLFIGILFYLQYFAWGSLNDVVGKQFVRYAFQSATPVFSAFHIPVSFDESMKDAIYAITRAQLEKEKKDIVERTQGDLEQNFSKLSLAAQEVLITKASGEIQKQLEERIGAFSLTESVGDVLYRLLKSSVLSLNSTLKSWSGAGIALTLFFSVKGFVALFYWAIEGIAFLFFKLLIALNFAYITLEQRSREFIVMK